MTKEATGADFKSATENENKKLFIETYGCQMNVADSEVIASIMQMAGYTPCDTLEEADAVFMNTCSIRDNAEQKILNRLEFFHSLRKKRKHLIVGVLGCMAERVKNELIEKHHVPHPARPDWSGRGRGKSHQCGTFHYGNLPRRHPFTHLRKPHFRLRVHHARVQQFLPLLYCALYTRTRTQP